MASALSKVLGAATGGAVSSSVTASKAVSQKSSSSKKKTTGSVAGSSAPVTVSAQKPVQTAGQNNNQPGGIAYTPQEVSGI